MTALDFPSSPSNGDIYENYVYDSTVGAWKRIASGIELGGISDVTITSPTDGQALVYDSATSTWVNGEGSTVPVIISETAPVSPEVGELWLNSTEAKMYVYYDDGSSAQWVAAVGGTVPSQGKILQVVSTTKTDTFSASITTGATSAITGFSATITPSSASNKILVFVSLSAAHDTTHQPAFVMKRGATSIAIGDADGASRSRISAVIGGPADNTKFSTISQQFLDSPSSTSSLTYSAELLNMSGLTRTMYVNRPVDNTDSATIGRAVSMITLMEVAA